RCGAGPRRGSGRREREGGKRGKFGKPNNRTSRESRGRAGSELGRHHHGALAGSALRRRDRGGGVVHPGHRGLPGQGPARPGLHAFGLAALRRRADPCQRRATCPVRGGRGRHPRDVPDVAERVLPRARPRVTGRSYPGGHRVRGRGRGPDRAGERPDSAAAGPGRERLRAGHRHLRLPAATPGGHAAGHRERTSGVVPDRRARVHPHSPGLPSPARGCVPAGAGPDEGTAAVGAAVAELTGLSVSYGHRPVLAGVDLRIGAGELVTIVGPSGAGKSTLLRVLAGLHSHDGGAVRRPEDDGGSTRTVFQEPHLLPWRTVERNVRLGLEYRANHRPGATVARERVAQVLADLGIAELAGRYPHQLSGGQAQRVAVARAVVTRPSLLLLDEPFGALDPLSRSGAQDWLLGLRANLDTAMVLVTHDLDEALYLGDRVAVL